MRGGMWKVSIWDGLRTTQQPHFPLLRSALAVARQHVGLPRSTATMRRIMAAADVLAAAITEGAIVHLSRRGGIVDVTKPQAAS